MLLDDEAVTDRPTDIGVRNVDPVVLQPLDERHQAVQTVLRVPVLFHLHLRCEQGFESVELLRLEDGEQLCGRGCEVHTHNRIHPGGPAT